MLIRVVSVLAILLLVTLGIMVIASCAQSEVKPGVPSPSSAPSQPPSSPSAPQQPPNPLPSPKSEFTILSITGGTVFIRKSGTTAWNEARAGMSLETGDTLTVKSGSPPAITFFDGTSVEIERDTEIEVASLHLAPGTRTINMRLKQTLGKTITRVTKLADPASRYEVETPAGVATVRGSTMLVEVIKFGATTATTVGNMGGNICFNNNRGTVTCLPEGAVLSVLAGMSSGEPAQVLTLPERPEPVPPTPTPKG